MLPVEGYVIHDLTANVVSNGDKISSFALRKYINHKFDQVFYTWYQ